MQQRYDTSPYSKYWGKNDLIINFQQTTIAGAVLLASSVIVVVIVLIMTATTARLPPSPPTYSRPSKIIRKQTHGRALTIR